MGQAPDDLRNSAARIDDTTYLTGATHEAYATTPVDSDDPEVIRNQIENTRADMTETIDAIQERLNPETLKAQAKDAVREATVGRAEEAVSNMSERAQEMVHDVTHSVSDAGTGLVDTIKQNPLPAAIAGIGLGWLWMNRSKTQHHQRSYYQPRRHTTLQAQNYYSPGFQEYERRESRYYRDQGRNDGGVLHSAQDAAGHAAHTVQDMAGSAAGTVQHTADQVMHQAGQFGSMAQHEMQDLRSRTDRMLHENPLPMGLLALGAGLAVGMLIPETEKENQLFGETREQMMEKAQSAAGEVVEKVQHVASDVAGTAQQSAQEQGLTNS